MYIGSFMVVLAILGIGLYFGIVGFGGYRNVVNTAENVSTGFLLKTAFYFGMAATLLFLAIIIISSLFEEDYSWNSQRIMGAVLISLIPGLITMLGGIYRIYRTLEYRNLLIEKLDRNNEGKL